LAARGFINKLSVLGLFWSIRMVSGLFAAPPLGLPPTPKSVPVWHTSGHMKPASIGGNFALISGDVPGKSWQKPAKAGVRNECRALVCDLRLPVWKWSQKAWPVVQ